MKKIIVPIVVLAAIVFSCSKDSNSGEESNSKYALSPDKLSGQGTQTAGRLTGCDTCNVNGTYAGTATPNSGYPSTMIYELRDNNFAVGTATIGGAGVTFGGYDTDCDSIYLSTHYGGNNSYYLLSGKFNSGRTVINGSFVNLTTPTDFGTFSITKQ
jgi:hypothetical protein